MKGKIIARTIFVILILGTFIAIFIFSSQDGKKSKSVSESFMKKIVDIYPKTSKLDDKEKQVIVKKSQTFIRKTAHFTIYMTAGILIIGFLSTYNLKWNKKLIITLILGLIYSILDELHQGYTGGGRTPRVFDVCIDFLGVLSGSIIVLGILKIFSFKKPRRLNKKNI